MEKIDVDYLPVWRRYLDQVERSKLTDQELGTLFRAMMKYQFEGEEPEGLNNVVQVFWAFIRGDLDHARERYESSVKNGKKGGRKKKKKPEETQLTLEEGKSITISESISESISIPESISKAISKTEKVHSPSPAKAEEDASVSKKVYGQYGWVVLSDQNYEQLMNEMGDAELQACITYIDESAQSTGNRKNWLDWCAVLRRCHQRQWHKSASL